MYLWRNKRHFALSFSLWSPSMCSHKTLSIFPVTGSFSESEWMIRGQVFSEDLFFSRATWSVHCTWENSGIAGPSWEMGMGCEGESINGQETLHATAVWWRKSHLSFLLLSNSGIMCTANYLAGLLLVIPIYYISPIVTGILWKQLMAAAASHQSAKTDLQWRSMTETAGDKATDRPMCLITPDSCWDGSAIIHLLSWPLTSLWEGSARESGKGLLFHQRKLTQAFEWDGGLSTALVIVFYAGTKKDRLWSCRHKGHLIPLIWKEK